MVSNAAAFSADSLYLMSTRSISEVNEDLHFIKYYLIFQEKIINFNFVDSDEDQCEDSSGS